MTRICPQCNYARQARDSAPEWQCPSCQIAYNKAGGTPPPERYRARNASTASNNTSGSGLKWILAVTIVGAGIWFAKPFEKLKSNAEETVVRSSQPAVTLYGTEWCGYCDAARTFFDKNGIQYKDVDIEKTTAGYEEHKRLGGRGVPLVVIDEKIIHGYNEETMRAIFKPQLNGS